MTDYEPLRQDPSPHSFAITDHPLAFELPRRLTDVSSWHSHIPFAFVAAELLAPRVFVELGTWKGDSYCAFAQAVATLGLATRCFAVDTWEGDDHTGRYDEAVLEELRQHHDPLYGGFSTLLQMPFDEALTRFEDGSVDLLHIDGYHTYEAVSHDFAAWLPKLGTRGVVLLHDTEERSLDFGVWRLWSELAGVYPGFSFSHGHGLGVLAVGSDVDERFLGCLAEAAEQATISELFAALGERIALVGSEQRRDTELSSARAGLAAIEAAAAGLSGDLERSRSELAATEQELATVRAHDERQRIELARLAHYETALEAVYGSLSWRLTSPLRRAKSLLRRTIHP